MFQKVTVFYGIGEVKWGGGGGYYYVLVQKKSVKKVKSTKASTSTKKADGGQKKDDNSIAQLLAAGEQVRCYDLFHFKKFVFIITSIVPFSGSSLDSDIFFNFAQLTDTAGRPLV